MPVKFVPLERSMSGTDTNAMQVENIYVNVVPNEVFIKGIVLSPVVANIELKLVPLDVSSNGTDLNL